MKALGSGPPPRTEILTAHFGGSGFDFMGAIAVFPDSSLPNRNWSCTYLSGSVITQVRVCVCVCVCVCVLGAGRGSSHISSPQTFVDGMKLPQLVISAPTAGVGYNLHPVGMSFCLQRLYD